MSLSDPEQVARQYENASNLDSRITLHQRFSVNDQPWQRWVFDRLDLPSNARVLELGCGTADFWTENRDRIPQNWRITLTDASPGMLKTARSNVNQNLTFTLTRNFTFIPTDARSTDFGDGEFEAVVANHMLYHVPKPDEVLAEAARVLRPGGIFYVTTNGLGHLREVDEMVRRLDPSRPRSELARSFATFTLENGEDRLLEHFSEVSLERREDALRVTEAKPLLAWILSSITAGEIAERIGEGEFQRRVSQLEEWLEHKISENGSIKISKDTGLFIARS